MIWPSKIFFLSLILNNEDLSFLYISFDFLYIKQNDQCQNFKTKSNQLCIAYNWY